MIESTTYLGIELLVAALLGGLSMLAVVPFVHSRAVRLTTRRLEAVIPLSMKEINADKEVLRDDLETNIEPLKTDSSSELAGREGDAINRLKTCLDALRDQLRATEEKLVLKTIATRERERALTDKELELAKLTTAFNERLALADLQKTEIVRCECNSRPCKDGSLRHARRPRRWKTVTMLTGTKLNAPCPTRHRSCAR